jgi:hypothetical protein
MPAPEIETADATQNRKELKAEMEDFLQQLKTIR